MDNAQKYLALESAARRATDAWLENDSAENHAAIAHAMQAAEANAEEAA